MAADVLQLLPTFRFHVDFREDPLSGQLGESFTICGGAFAECSGLEATMEPFAVAEGGNPWGSAQRPGKVSFAPVILKRGMTTTQDPWKWFEVVSRGGYAYRLAVSITIFDTAGEGRITWRLRRALPVKFKSADFQAKTSDIAIEELHLAHEGLEQGALEHAILPSVGGLR